MLPPPTAAAAVGDSSLQMSSFLVSLLLDEQKQKQQQRDSGLLEQQQQQQQERDGGLLLEQQLAMLLQLQQQHQQRQQQLQLLQLLHLEVAAAEEGGLCGVGGLQGLLTPLPAAVQQAEETVNMDGWLFKALMMEKERITCQRAYFNSKANYNEKKVNENDSNNKKIFFYNKNI
jgi:hypothetical protein